MLRWIEIRKCDKMALSETRICWPYWINASRATYYYYNCHIGWCKKDPSLVFSFLLVYVCVIRVLLICFCCCCFLWIFFFLFLYGDWPGYCYSFILCNFSFSCFKEDNTSNNEMNETNISKNWDSSFLFHNGGYRISSGQLKCFRCWINVQHKNRALIKYLVVSSPNSRQSHPRQIYN